MYLGIALILINGSIGINNLINGRTNLLMPNIMGLICGILLLIR